MAKHDAKLTVAQVKEIRRLVEQGVPNLALANKYGVSRQTICDIKARRSWKKI